MVLNRDLVYKTLSKYTVTAKAEDGVVDKQLKHHQKWMHAKII